MASTETRSVTVQSEWTSTQERAYGSARSVQEMETSRTSKSDRRPNGDSMTATPVSLVSPPTVNHQLESSGSKPSRLMACEMACKSMAAAPR
eukprot:7382095-Prymnesium_polylepis.1